MLKKKNVGSETLKPVNWEAFSGILTQILLTRKPLEMELHALKAPNIYLFRPLYANTCTFYYKNILTNTI